MNEIFTFAGLISHDHDFIIGFYAVVAAVIALFLARLSTRSMQIVPGAIQNVFEALLEGILHMARDVIGDEKARKYLPLTGTIAILIFVSNIIGIIPGFESPTSSLNFTLTLALVVFFYYNFEGIKTHGFVKYFAHFAGPVKALAPLLFPIEIISHCSRVISLSFRLFGNIKGDDMFLLVMLMLAPWLAPLPAFVILTFMAFLQAFIFMILTYVFLAGAVLVEEEAGH